MEPARGERCLSGQRRGPAAPEEIESHPWIRNPSISLQLPQPGDENGDPPGRYRPARCGNPKPTGWLLIGWSSCSQCAARISPRDNVEVPLPPGRIGSYPRIRNPSISLQLTPTTWGRKRGSPRVDTAPHCVKIPTILAGWKLAGAHGASGRRGLLLWPTSRSHRARGG